MQNITYEIKELMSHNMENRLDGKSNATLKHVGKKVSYHVATGELNAVFFKQAHVHMTTHSRLHTHRHTAAFTAS